MSNNKEWVGGKKVYGTEPEQHEEDWLNQDFGFEGDRSRMVKAKNKSEEQK